MKRTRLKPSKTQINRYSKARIQKFYDEFSERHALIKRCGGYPLVYYEIYNPYKKEPVFIPRVRCNGGVCEICGKPALAEDGLEPHEERRRSHGATVSLSDSLMVHRACHNGKHPGVRLEWIK
ncbi:hypothetical protein LCGC14_0861820 [marine sediment metagenome]|uniref:HNH domain-containing protein n=1 Tax=marine sediment metagenome TaxID=412755 RepID=A0A0F9RRU1_9ZZZZ